MQRFLWFLGGFDAETLSSEVCRPVRPKYSSMGGLVLMTAILAVCSGGYALDSIFDNRLFAVGLGALWGMFILFFDRYLLSSTRKLARIRDFFTSIQGTPPYKVHSSWSLRWGLLVRVVLASFIGVVVAKPIEMRILKPWVLAHKSEQGQASFARHRIQLKPLEDEIARQRERIDRKSAELAELRRGLACELDGTCGTRKIGAGPIATIKKGGVEQTETELQAQQANLEELVTRYKRELADLERLESEGKNDDSIINGLLAIRELGSAGDTRAHLVASVSLFITLLFVGIEIAPIVSKAFAPFDVYDAMLTETEHSAILRALSTVRQSHEDAVAREEDR